MRSKSTKKSANKPTNSDSLISATISANHSHALSERHHHDDSTNNRDTHHQCPCPNDPDHADVAPTHRWGMAQLLSRQSTHEPTRCANLHPQPSHSNNLVW